MDKLKLAHDYLLKIMSNSPLVDDADIEFAVDTAWKYARLMYDEKIKDEKIDSQKKRKEISEMLNADNTFLEKEGQHFDDVADVCKTYSSSEWQPDWSQAPEWANWWAMDMDLCQAHWYEVEPSIDVITWRRRTRICKCALSFNYQGKWQDSLRKRPQ